jgi:putative protein-disulfide isomerase
MAHLVYIVDPMCSWCFGFEPALAAVVRERGLRVELVMGGLAPDSDEPMTEEMRGYVQNAWRAVTERTGVEFNHAFWETCEPRRSTYPACRAVIAAGALDGKGSADGAASGLWLDGVAGAMLHAIQRAYYREARNPSDVETLVACAEAIGLDGAAFAGRLAHPDTELALRRQFARRTALGATGFPSLAWWEAGEERAVAGGCLTARQVKEALDALR